jgi:hypothetical protein
MSSKIMLAHLDMFTVFREAATTTRSTAIAFQSPVPDNQNGDQYMYFAVDTDKLTCTTWKQEYDCYLDMINLDTKEQQARTLDDVYSFMRSQTVANFDSVDRASQNLVCCDSSRMTNVVKTIIVQAIMQAKFSM